MKRTVYGLDIAGILEKWRQGEEISKSRKVNLWPGNEEKSDRAPE